MKTVKSLILACLIVASGVAAAAPRQIFLIQQRTPGVIQFVSMLDDGKNCLVMVGNREAPRDARKIVIDTKLFKSLWELGNSKPLRRYRFKPGEVQNLAEPDYYTATLRDESGSKIYLRIPVKGANKEASEFINRIVFYIGQIG